MEPPLWDLHENLEAIGFGVSRLQSTSKGRRTSCPEKAGKLAVLPSKLAPCITSTWQLPSDNESSIVSKPVFPSSMRRPSTSSNTGLWCYGLNRKCSGYSRQFWSPTGGAVLRGSGNLGRRCGLAGGSGCWQKSKGSLVRPKCQPELLNLHSRSLVHGYIELEGAHQRLGNQKISCVRKHPRTDDLMSQSTDVLLMDKHLVSVLH